MEIRDIIVDVMQVQLVVIEEREPCGDSKIPCKFAEKSLSS